MIGAIAGDIIGSVYEWNNIKTKQFDLFSPDCCFTDDSVLTVALAESILTGAGYASLMRAYYRRYPNAGYGGFFTNGRELANASLTIAGAMAPLCASVRLGLRSTRWTKCWSGRLNTQP